MTMTPIRLLDRERQLLHQLLTANACGREVLRARALLMLSQGMSVEDVADRLGVCRQAVYNWIRRFQERKQVALPARLADAYRSGRKRRLPAVIDPLIEQVRDDDPRSHGYRGAVWTPSSLGQYLRDYHQVRVCRQSVERAMERVGMRELMSL